MRECCKGDKASQWGNGKFDPLPRPNLNRSSPKVAYVITSWISIRMQNLVMIPQGVSFPVCAKLRIKDVYLASFFTGSGFFQRPTAQAREQIFTQNTSNDVVPCKDVSFRVRKKFTPYFRKLPLLGPLLTGQKHYRPKNRFTMGDAPYTAYAQHIANFAIKMAHLHCFHPLLSNGSS